MPVFEAFVLAAPEVFGAEAVGAELLAAPELLGLGASELAGLGAAGVEGATAVPGITQAGMAADAAAGGAGAGSAGINAAQVQAGQAAASQAANSGIANAGIQSVPEVMSPAQQSFTQAANSSFTPPNVASDAYSNLGTQGANMLPQPPPTNFADVNQIASQGFGPPAAPPVAPPANAPFTAYPPEGGIPPEFNAYTSPLPTAAPTSALEKGMNTAVEFAKKNPFTALAGTTMVAQKLGLFNPSGATFNQQNYSGPLSKYKLSPDFKGTNVNPANFQYNPKGYAGGGIMNANQMNPNSIAVGYDGGGDIPQYAKGGSLTDSIEQYQKMLSGAPQTIPDTKTDVGIFHDTDPDTRYQDALTAAQIRQSKINQRAYVSPPVAKRPTPMGQLQMASVKPRKQGGADDVEAAQGGVMHASLGGYAAGGNPRLLQGPGDGMSDNIPATINGRQPARLADGEFVIPADVVSHLGNGSTEAGAKQLHAMMDKVRSARTGNSKQGKQINPKKYMPK